MVEKAGILNSHTWPFKTKLRLRHPSELPFFPINTSSLLQDNVSVASEGRLRAAVANRMKNHRNLANTATIRQKSIDTVTTEPARGIDSSVESQLNETVDGINPDRVRVEVHQSPVQSQHQMTAASTEGTGLIDNSLFGCCCAVFPFPTGRFFGRITRKGPSKKCKRPYKSVAEFWPEMAEKRPIIYNVLFPVFFPCEK
jgi:hypothetical protein